MAKKLLVADDSLTIQKVIKLALSGDGYEIQTVSDGNECLQQIALFRPDVVLIDVGIPGRTAFDLKKAANEDPEMSRIPFVLMSSAFEKVDEAKVALLRFDGRLTKPFDPSNLKGVLTAALQMNSGQTIKDFVPSAAPSTGFNLEPSDRSRQMPRPPSFGITNPNLSSNTDNEVTGEIQLMDPKLGHSSPSIQSTGTPLLDPLWSDTPASDSHHDADIRNLTESTVKMSGLDDLGGWNIEENSKTSLPPIPDMFTNTGISQPSFTHPALSQSGISLTSENESHLLDLEIGSPTPTSPSIAMPPRPPFSQTANPPTQTMAFGIGTSPSQNSLENMVAQQVREQLEMMVQGAVKTQLEQMARKALPEIAERVVKAEIRKMLEGLAGGNSD
jgi:two-component system cell cycle response regulator